MQIQFEVNGRQVSADVDPMTTLAHYLRYDLGLTGSKLSCEVGECGSCTVLLDGRPVTSCIVPIAQASGRSVQTIEGLSSGDQVSALQQSFVNENAVQCGFCIPGMVMAATAFLANRTTATRDEVRRGLTGNLCRCTGYEKIVDAVTKVVGNGGSRG